MPEFPEKRPSPPPHLFPSEPLGKKKSPPKYARQKRQDTADLAYVRIDGKRHYLGPYGSPESRQRYQRLIAEYQTHGKINGPEVRDAITVEEVAEQYMWFAQRYYRREGQPTAEPANIALALRWLIALCGKTPARRFGPKALRMVRDQFVARKCARNYINHQVDRIKRMFKWAVAEELVPASVYHGLQALTGLRFGHTEAPEPEPVQPVAEDLIAPVRQFVSRQVAAMIDLQMLTGARPGEIVLMRPIDIDTGGDVWMYFPERHKTQQYGRPRVILLGPKAQILLKPLLAKRASDVYVFSPQEAEAERYAELHAQRKTPDNQGNHAGAGGHGRSPRKFGDHYDRTSYARAIARACELAFPLPVKLRPPLLPDGKPQAIRDYLRVVIPEKREAIEQWRKTHHWHPNQLRHDYATNVRRRHGLEIAQILLGHARADVTQIYAERDLKRALEIAKKDG
jgi:integrase